ncbi:hypothetical protein AN958_12146 [Leucoagaricus sp. SymC.cos]|nr:hypothetical protein AN958_12146 [Leucoagaricus sp. SymC.cos]
MAEIVRSVREIQSRDIVIAFMGPTGSGKSFFIDLLTGNPGQRAGHSLKSVTADIQATRVRHEKYGDNIVLVDTPGFDDTLRSDMEILTMISDWLEKTYKNDVKLSGLVYLHRISDNRMAGTPHKNLRMFGKLSGDTAMNHVILVSTMWSKVRQQVGEEREGELREQFWKPLITKGSRIDRLNPANRTEAWRIIDQLIKEREKRDAVLLQEEIVDLRRQLNETEAGKALYTSLQKLLASQKEALGTMLTEINNLKDPKLKKELEKEYKKTEAQFQKTFEDMRTMKIPLGKTILMFFFGKRTRAKAIKIAPVPGEK